MLDLYTVNSVCLIVPEGGYIFECYLYGHSPYQINKNFLGYLRQANEEFRPSILPWQNEELLEQSHNHFMGYILYSLSAVGSNGNKQYFYHTLCCNFHGLSRQGQIYLSRLGLANKLRSFDAIRQTCIDKSIRLSKYLFFLSFHFRKIILFFYFSKYLFVNNKLLDALMCTW